MAAADDIASVAGRLVVMAAMSGVMGRGLVVVVMLAPVELLHGGVAIGIPVVRADGLVDVYTGIDAETTFAAALDTVVAD